MANPVFVQRGASRMVRSVVAALLAVTLPAGPLAAPAQAEDGRVSEAPAEYPQSPATDDHGDALSVDQKWNFFTSAYLSAVSDPQGISQVTNAANTNGTFSVGIRRPKPPEGGSVRLTVLGDRQLQTEDGRQLMQVTAPFDRGVMTLKSQLGQLCKPGTLHGRAFDRHPDPADPEVTCVLDPGLWGPTTDGPGPTSSADAPGGGQTGSGSAGTAVRGKKGSKRSGASGTDSSGDQSVSAGAFGAVERDVKAKLAQRQTEWEKSASASAKANQTAAGNSDDAVRFVQLGLGPVPDPTSIGAPDSPGQERAANLDTWLKRIAGDRLSNDTDGMVDVQVSSAVQLITYDGGNQQVGDPINADIKWSQCFRPAEDSVLQSSCRPQSSDQLVYSADNSENTNPELDVYSQMAADTTDPTLWGDLSPGHAWAGNMTYANLGVLRGWSGPSPFVEPDKDHKGRSTQYVFTDVAPGYIEDPFVTAEKASDSTRIECQFPEDSVLPDSNGKGGKKYGNNATFRTGAKLHPYLPEDIARAGVVCGVSQNEFVQPFLTHYASNGGVNQWNPDFIGNFSYQMAYDVPKDFLAYAANNPTWKPIETVGKQWKYPGPDEEGEPELVEVKTTDYVSAVKPAVWAWVPKECVRKNTGDPQNAIACAAEAAPNFNADVSAAPGDLELVKIAEAGSFTRRVCGTCWPSPATGSVIFTRPKAEIDAARARNGYSALDAKTRNAGLLMQGQDTYVAVNTLNQSQTAGYWSQLKIVIDGVPDGVTVSPDRAIKHPADDPKGDLPWPQQGVEELVAAGKLSPDAFTCSKSDQPKQWACGLKDEAKDLDALGLPRDFETGSYSFLIRLDAGVDATPTPEDGEEELVVRSEYPNFRKGEPDLGSDPSLAVTAGLRLLKQDAALVTSTAQIPNPQLVVDPNVDHYVPVSGDPIDIPVMQKDQPVVSQQLRFQVANAGQRWIRPKDELTMSVDLPSGVDFDKRADSKGYRTDYVVGNRESAKLKELGEQWDCGDPIANTSKGYEFGFEFTWTTYSLDCRAVVSNQRPEFGLVASDDPTKDLNAQFPSLLLELTGAVQSLNDQDQATARVRVAHSGQTISVDTDNSLARARVDVVDPNTDFPTVQPYWLVRPVAGGQAAARVDVANKNRGAASGMNVLVEFTHGATFSAPTDQSANGWSCRPVNEGQAATCHYEGFLRENRPGMGDPDRTKPLLIEAQIPADADVSQSDAFRMMMRADVLNIPVDADFGDDPGGLSYQLGRPMVSDPTSPATGAVSITADLGEQNQQVSTGAGPLAFGGEVSQPNGDGSTIQLDGIKSTGPFDQQPMNYTWEQQCVEGQPVDPNAGCNPDDLTPAVQLFPSNRVTNPGFEIPTSQAKPQEYVFKLTVTDPLLATDTVPVVRPGEVDLAKDVKPNAKSTYLRINVTPPGSATTEQGHQAGGAQQGPVAPGEPQIAGTTTTPDSITLSVNGPKQDGGSLITGYQYSTDNGATWAPAEFDPANSSIRIVNQSANVATTAELEANQQAVRFDPIQAGTNYQIAVRAVNGVGGGTPSTSVTVSPGQQSASPAPTSPSPPADNGSPTAIPSPDHTETTPTPSVSPSTPVATPSPTTPPHEAPADCAALVGSASTKLGVNFDLAKGQSEVVDGACKITDGEVAVYRSLQLGKVAATISKDQVSITSGEVQAGFWEFRAGSGITVTQEVKLPVPADARPGAKDRRATAGAQVQGKLEGDTVPFGELIGKVLSLDVSDIKMHTAFTFRAPQQGSSDGFALDLDADATRSAEGSTSVKISGPVKRSGDYTVNVNLDRLFSIQDAQVSAAGSLVHTVAKDDKPEQTTWNISGQTPNIIVSDAPKVVLDINDVSLKGGTEDPKTKDNGVTIDANLKIGGDPGLKETVLKLQGGLTTGSVDLKASQTDVSWSLLPDFKFNMNQSLTVNRENKDFSIEIDGNAVGNQDFANKHITLTEPRAKLFIKKATPKPDGENPDPGGPAAKNVDVSGEVSGKMTVTGDDDNAKMPLDVAGQIAYKRSAQPPADGEDKTPDGWVVHLEAKQPEGNEFDPVSGVTLTNTNLSFDYRPAQPKEADSTGAGAEPTPPKGQVNAELSGKAAVTLPNSSTTTKGEVKARYSDKGVFFQISDTDTPWSIADGVPIEGLLFVYQSYVDDYVPDGKFKVAGLPEKYSKFAGLLALGTTQPQSGSFLRDTLGFGNDGTRLGAYVRLDTKKKEFQGAVMSDSDMHIFGDPGDQNSASLVIQKPYLMVTYAAAEKPAAGRVTLGAAAPAGDKVLTVALGGTGKLRYLAESGPVDYDKLDVGATMDLTAKTFSGSVKLGEEWKDAGGIAGLNLKKGAIDLGIKGAQPADGGDVSKKLTASVFANVEVGEAPGFLTRMGLVAGAPVVVGFEMGSNWCARLSIGEDTPKQPSGGLVGAEPTAAKKIALRPFQFMGDLAGQAMEVSFASFVFVSPNSQCKIGGEELKTTSIKLKGTLLKVVPLDVSLQAKPAGNGKEIQAKSPDGDNQLESVAFGPATITGAKVNVDINTGSGQKLRSGDSLGLVLTGNLPIGDNVVAVTGKVSADLGKQLLDLHLEAAADKMEFGKFQVTNPKLQADVQIAAHADKPTNLDGGLGVKIAGDAQLLGHGFPTEIEFFYKGGAIQHLGGSIGARDGVQVGDKFVVAGSGTLVWDVVTGLEVTIGTPPPKIASPEAAIAVARTRPKAGADQDGASFQYCPTGAQTVTQGEKKTASCIDASKAFGFTKAYLDINPKGFSSQGRLQLGTMFSGDLTGAYYHQDADNEIEIRGTKFLPKAGDFAFGVTDATLSLPTGAVKAGLLIENMHDSGGSETNRVAVDFALQILGRPVAFSGDFTNTGLFDISADAAGMTLGGFGIDRGHVQVANMSGGQPLPATNINLDLNVSLGSWGQAHFAGFHGQEVDEKTGSSAIGTRVKGDFKFQVATVEADAGATYSDFPKDSGFSFAAHVSIATVDVMVGGVFREVDGVTLYRAGGAVSIPVFEGVNAVGVAQLDNCVNKDNTPCAEARMVRGEIAPKLTIKAGLTVGKIVTVAVQGDVRLNDGAFRFVGSGKAGVNFGPWSFFKVITAEAGFSLSAGVCFANQTAVSDPNNPMGCGQKQMDTWAAGLEGRAYASITLDLWIWKGTASLSVEILGSLHPDRSNFCAIFRVFGYSITFGTCPSPDDKPPVVDPKLDPSDYV